MWPLTYESMDTDAPTEPSLDTTALDPLAPERVADRLLIALRDAGPIAFFDWADDAATTTSIDVALDARKTATDLLVTAKLASFDDDARTMLAITNAGRYWALHGGYLGYLKENPAGAGGGGRQRNPEMEALRSEYMKLRLNTFWWSFGLSVAGFIMSIISVAIALFYGDRLLR